MPFTRVEVALLSLVEDRLCVLLGKRQEAPYKGRWAIPGGVVRIDLDADLEAAARRVARERLNVSLPYLRQIGAVGGAARDPRAPWALSVVYRALVDAQALAATPGKRLETLGWWPADVVQEAKPAFDHGALVAQAVDALRAEVDRLELPFGFLPPSFTLGELQALCEALLGRRLDKSSFRRQLAERELLEPVPGEMRTGAFRPRTRGHRLRAPYPGAAGPDPRRSP